MTNQDPTYIEHTAEEWREMADAAYEKKNLSTGTKYLYYAHFRNIHDTVEEATR